MSKTTLKMQQPRRKTKIAIFSTALLTQLVAPSAYAAPWEEKFYNPKPLEGDVILPMPCEGSMVFRVVKTETHSPLEEKSIILGSDNSADQIAEHSTPNAIAGSFGDKSQGRYFLMAKYEVSQLQYQSVMNEQCPSANMKGRLPMTEVSWFDAVEFTRKYNEWLLKNAADKLPSEDGTKGFVRLPTNAEWEYAARGGAAVSSSEFREPLFPMRDGAEKYVWSNKNANGKIQLTGQLEGNPLGLFDTLGNAAEMMFDAFKLNRLDHYHGQSGGVTVRGGSYLNSAESLTNAYRIERPLYHNGNADKAKDIGFRVAMVAPVLTSAQRIKDLKEEWAKLGRDDNKDDKHGAGSNVVGQLEKLAQDVQNQTIAKEQLEKELKKLNDTLRQANQARDEQRDSAIQASLRLGGFLCSNVVDLDNTYQNALSLAENIKQTCDGASKEGLCAEDQINNLNEKKLKAENALKFTLKYYADTLVDNATLYNASTIEKQVEITKQRLQNREKNNAAQFIQSYWEQLSQYNKDGKVDRDAWLKSCRQVK